VLELFLMKKRKQLIVIVLSVVVIVFLGSVVFLKGRGSGQTKSQTNVEVSPPAQVSDEATDSADSKTIKTREGSLSIPKNLPEGVSINNFKSVDDSGVSANFIAVVDGKTFALIVEAQLKDPASGTSYWAWIAKDNEFKNVYKVVKLEKNNNVYSINFSQNGDFTAYKYIMVTSEVSDDDKPETKVLEGSF